jgi:hypothetical protein
MLTRYLLKVCGVADSIGICLLGGLQSSKATSPPGDGPLPSGLLQQTYGASTRADVGMKFIVSSVREHLGKSQRPFLRTANSNQESQN